MDLRLNLALQGFGYPLLLAAFVLVLARRPWKGGARAPAWAVGLAPAAAFALACILVRGWTAWWPSDRHPDHRLPHTALAACILGIVAGLLLGAGAGKTGTARKVRLVAFLGLAVAAGAGVAWALTPHRRGGMSGLESALLLAAWGGVAGVQWFAAERLARSLPASLAAAVCAAVVAGSAFVLLGSAMASLAQLAGLLALAFVLVAAFGMFWGRVPVAPGASAVAALTLTALWICNVVLNTDPPPWLRLVMLAAALPGACAAGLLRKAPRWLRLTIQAATPLLLAGAAAALAIRDARANMY